MIPKRSPWSLIQEDLWPDEFKILVACILLNRTPRRQVEKVINKLFENWPDAKSLSCANKEDVARVLTPIGLQNRRAVTLIKFSKDFLKPTWDHASELHGIGDYAADAWEIFCKNKIPNHVPKDGALVRYYNWRTKNEKRD